MLTFLKVGYLPPLMSDDNVRALNQPYDIDFQKRGGLVPVILQDADSGQIIKVAYANKAAVRKTIQEKQPICFNVRDNKEFRVKDFTLYELRIDCDQDALVYLGMSDDDRLDLSLDISDRLDFTPVHRPDDISFSDFQNGLVPAIAQEYGTGDVLMLGYANAEALKKAMAVEKATFWSTSRDELWTKGDTSGDFLRIKSISRDSHGSVILYEVDMAGTGSCHTKDSAGNTRKSCFYRRIDGDHMQFLDGQQ